jgi:hypothetical protein
VATGPWITISFVPTTTQLYAHKVNPRAEGNATLIDEVIGWLVQHQYNTETKSVVRSRVVAGVMNDDGLVYPAQEATMPVGVYPAGMAPGSSHIESARQFSTNS